ncbi:MAG: hypothetical protein ACLFP8_00255 [Alphaproteobacteria bacterium]
MKIRHMTRALLMILALMHIAPLHAQEETTQESAPTIADYPVKYSYEPEYCDFIAKFPEEPITSHRCENEEDPGTCYDLVSYTKVFDLSTTVRVDVICNPASEEMFEYFKPEVMEQTVRAMTKDTVLETYNVSTQDQQDHRITGLVGQGRKGLDDTLYIAQLWVSENSIMSIEAELSGEQRPEADKLLAGILNNLGHIRNIENEKYFQDKEKQRQKDEKQE